MTPSGWGRVAMARIHRTAASQFARDLVNIQQSIVEEGVENVAKLTRGSPMDSCHGNPSPSDPMESVCRYFPPPPQVYFAVYLSSLSQTDSRQSDGFLPPQPVSIGSDGVRLSKISTPSSTILCCIFTKSLAN